MRWPMLAFAVAAVVLGLFPGVLTGWLGRLAGGLFL